LFNDVTLLLSLDFGTESYDVNIYNTNQIQIDHLTFQDLKFIALEEFD